MWQESRTYGLVSKSGLGAIRLELYLLTMYMDGPRIVTHLIIAQFSQGRPCKEKMGRGGGGGRKGRVEMIRKLIKFQSYVYRGTYLAYMCQK